MAQSQNLHQTQTESQIQKLSPQQLMVVKLVELPLADLEERVKNEVIDTWRYHDNGSMYGYIGKNELGYLQYKKL